VSSLVLDTHVWIWLIEGEERHLSAKSRRRIVDSGQKGSLNISAITLWEVSLLEAKGRVRLGCDCLSWMTEALTAPGISVVALSPQIAVESNHLPGLFHGDPADRMIVATARHLGAAVVTKDERILDYARKGFVKSLQA
jgi:PIN domain nuclease of toxin-antitoxin system